MFDLSEIERKDIDHQLEMKLEWAAQRSIEAEQLSLDAARLLSVTGERLDGLKKQGFFKRCWNSFSGANHSLENANVADLIDMQKKSFRFIELLQERELMLAHSMLALKNNLLALAVAEEGTRNLVALLADRTAAKFEELERRVDQLEISQNLQGWLLTLGERNYKERYPTVYIRLLRVINDYFKIKSSDWNLNDFFFMRKAIRDVRINPEALVSMGSMIDRLVNEIEGMNDGLRFYNLLVYETQPSPAVDNYSKFVLDNTSGQAFCVIHGLNYQYSDQIEVVEALRDELNCDQATALKRILRRIIANMNVNMEVKLPVPEMAFEMLACMRMAHLLAAENCSNMYNGNAISPEEPGTIFSNISENESTTESAEEPDTIFSNISESESTAESDDEQTQEEMPGTEDGENASEAINILEMETSPHWTKIDLGSKIGRERVHSTGHIDLAFIANEWILIIEGVVYSSPDMREWSRIHDFGCCDGKMIKENGDFFFFSSTKYVSIFNVDLHRWEKLNLPTSYNDRTISYEGVFHDGDQWIFWGTVFSTFSYTKKGIFKNSKDSSHFFAGVVVRTVDFKSFEVPNSTASDLCRYTIEKIAYGNGHYVALGRYMIPSQEEANPVNKPKHVLIFSLDAKNWKKSTVNFTENDRFFVDAGLMFFQGKFWAIGADKCRQDDKNNGFFISANGQDWVKIKGAGGLASNSICPENIKIINGGNALLIPTTEHPLRFFREFNGFIITNDLISYVKIDNCPIKEILAFACHDNTFVAIGETDYLVLAWCSLKKTD